MYIELSDHHIVNDDELKSLVINTSKITEISKCTDEDFWTISLSNGNYVNITNDAANVLLRKLDVIKP